MNDFELLLSRLRQWQRWSRLQKSIYFGLRGLVLGFLVFAIAAIFLILSGRLLISEYFVLLIASGLLGVIVGAGIAWLWPQSRLKMAREYEQVFDLKERVSMAIELGQLENVDQAWQQLQLNDALEVTKQIVPKDGLQWRIPKLEISLLLVAFAFVLSSWFYGQRSFQQAETNAQNQQLVENEIENLEELITNIENSEQLSDETKDAVTTPLKESLEKMKQAESPEEAISALSDAQQTLEEVSQSGTEEFEGLQTAGEELAKNQDSPLTLMGEALSQGNLQAAAKELASLDLRTLNAKELATLSEQFMEMSQGLESASPELAEQFQQAAEALQNQDMPAAQEAIAKASESISNSAQRAETSETARNSAAELANMQGQLMAAMFGTSSQSSGMKSSSSESPTGEQKGSFGSQAGSGEFEESKTPGQEAGLTPLTQKNQPGDSSEKQYDSVYAPQRLGGTSETELSLGTGEDASSNAIGGLGSTFTQNAQSSVPYSEVYSSYEESTQQALESGSIPLSLQPIVREYFSSLDPTR
jgi:myosin heavy subunit